MTACDLGSVEQLWEILDGSFDVLTVDARALQHLAQQLNGDPAFVASMLYDTVQEAHLWPAYDIVDFWLEDWAEQNPDEAAHVGVLRAWLEQQRSAGHSFCLTLLTLAQEDISVRHRVPLMHQLRHTPTPNCPPEELYSVRTPPYELMATWLRALDKSADLPIWLYKQERANVPIAATLLELADNTLSISAQPPVRTEGALGLHRKQ